MLWYARFEALREAETKKMLKIKADRKAAENRKVK